MPAPTRVGIYDGNYYSLSTGLPLKSSPFKKKDGSLKANYLEPVAVSMADLDKIRATAKATRNAYAKERAPGYAAARKTSYKNNMLKIYPHAYENIAPYSSGKERKVGSNKDSLLSAINNTVATISGIPLNKHNRAVINEIYSAEVLRGSMEVGKMFKNHREDWDYGKRKAVNLYKTSEMAPIRIKKPEAREAWAERYSYGGKSAPALTRKAMLYSRLDYPDVGNVYRIRR